jgi:hypothetical protein
LIFNRAATEQQLLEQMRQYLPLYTFKGIYIYVQRYWSEKPQNQDVMQEYKKHLDAVHALTVAGWEPVPFAEPLDQGGSIVPDILVERFGSKCFTLYNGGDQTIDFSVDIDLSNIGLSDPPTGVSDWETGQVLPSILSGSRLTVSGLGLASHAVQILVIQEAQSPPLNDLLEWHVYLPLILRHGGEDSPCA